MALCRSHSPSTVKAPPMAQGHRRGARRSESRDRACPNRSSRPLDMWPPNRCGPHCSVRTSMGSTSMSSGSSAAADGSRSESRGACATRSSQSDMAAKGSRAGAEEGVVAWCDTRLMGASVAMYLARYAMYSTSTWSTAHHTRWTGWPDK